MLTIDYDRLYEIADANVRNFSLAIPFRHVVIDRFLLPNEYAAVCESFPKPDDDIWKKPENVHTMGKMVTRRGGGDLKEKLFSEQARCVFHELHSSLFLRFLNILSGIDGLTCDPYFAEGGFHCSENRGYLDIHADFSHHDFLGLERRLNLILYLNEDWKEEYGGALLLCDKDANPVTSVLPIGNRCLIFETTETSFHGHPEPMQLPDGIHRRSLALYYYSIPTGRKKSKIVFPEDRDFTFSVTTD